MALTNFSLSANNTGGPITYVVINDPTSGQHLILPNSSPLVLSGKTQRLTIVALETTMYGYDDLNHLLVTVDTYDSHGGQIGHSSWVAGNDPYIDVSAAPNATRYVTFSIYHPPIVYTHYQLYCSDDVSSFGVSAGNAEYVCTADNSPLVFNYEGDVFIHDVKGPRGESCAASKVDITSDGSTWLMSSSSAIPEKRGGTRSAFVRYFGIEYQAYFRSMQDGFSYGIYVNGSRKATARSTDASVQVIIHSNDEVTLSGFSHTEGYGRPWNVYADSNGSWQSTSSEQTGGSYKLWFQSRNRRVQVKPSSKREMRFNWWSEVYDPVKIKAKKFFSVNMTASCWNRFCQKIYDTYRLWGMYPSGSLPTVSSNDELTAGIFNSAGEIVSGLPGAGSCPEAISGKVVKAADFHAMKAALNAAIEHYMDSDD